METTRLALIAAGLLGGGVALVHGGVIQRLMVRPIGARLSEARTSNSVRRLVPVLLQFSTWNWFVCGLALIAAGYGLGSEARTAIAVLVGSSYLFAAVGNFWATRGRHPGWVLYSITVGLIIYAVW